MAASQVIVQRHKYRYRTIGKYDNTNGTKVQNKATITLPDGRKIGTNIKVALTLQDSTYVDETTIKELELYKAYTYPAGLGDTRAVVLIFKDLNTSTLRDLDYDITEVAGG